MDEVLHTIELIEAFKLGGKEAYIFFREQDLLNENINEKQVYMCKKILYTKLKYYCIKTIILL